MENQIEVLRNCVIQLCVIDDNNQRHRSVFTPDMNISDIQDIEVKEVAQTTWTEQVIADYKASIIVLD